MPRLHRWAPKAFKPLETLSAVENPVDVLHLASSSVFGDPDYLTLITQWPDMVAVKRL